MLLSSCLTIRVRHWQTLSLYKLERLFMFCICNTCSTFDSWQFCAIMARHLSASSAMKWFVSDARFINVFTIETRHGSITLLRVWNMSAKVISAILDTADRNESACLLRVPTRLWSELPVCNIMLWWCLQTLRMTLQASNWSNQSSLYMPWFLERDFLYSFSGFSSGSSWSDSTYYILLDWVKSAGSSPLSPVANSPIASPPRYPCRRGIPADWSSCFDWLFEWFFVCEKDLFWVVALSNIRSLSLDSSRFNCFMPWALPCIFVEIFTLAVGFTELDLLLRLSMQSSWRSSCWGMPPSAALVALMGPAPPALITCCLKSLPSSRIWVVGATP